MIKQQTSLKEQNGPHYHIMLEQFETSRNGTKSGCLKQNRREKRTVYGEINTNTKFWDCLINFPNKKLPFELYIQTSLIYLILRCSLFSQWFRLCNNADSR